MEPVTHILTGAVLARAGFNRRAAYATVAMAIAAEMPDLDTVSSMFGPVAGFEHHRGITHTFAAVPFEAALLTLVFFGVHRMRRRPATRAPTRWGWLFAGTLAALLSHLLLDWTNNYGIRPFFPFNPRWYAGSFVFIFEPVLWLILVAALGMPLLFRLINGEVGAGAGSAKTKFIGRPSAIAALVAIAALYLLRFHERQSAIHLVADEMPGVSRVFASPHPLNPWLWSTVADTPDALQLMTVHTNSGTIDPPAPADTLRKPDATPVLDAARQTRLGRVYLDWSSWPVLSAAPDDTDPRHPLMTVTFADARFLYNTGLLQGRPGNGSAPPLSATVLLDMAAPAGQRLVETRMGGRMQK